MNKEVKEFKELLKPVNPERLDEYGLMIFKGINVLLDYINQLETNWEELKKWLEEDETKAMWTISSGRHFNYNDALNKIAELERGKE